MKRTKGLTYCGRMSHDWDPVFRELIDGKYVLLTSESTSAPDKLRL